MSKAKRLAQIAQRRREAEAPRQPEPGEERDVRQRLIDRLGIEQKPTKPEPKRRTPAEMPRDPVVAGARQTLIRMLRSLRTQPDVPPPPKIAPPKPLPIEEEEPERHSCCGEGRQAYEKQSCCVGRSLDAIFGGPHETR
jgi:hypothetical protein